MSTPLQTGRHCIRVLGRNRTDKYVEGWTDGQTDLPRGIGFHLQAGDPEELVVLVSLSVRAWELEALMFWVPL